MERDSCKMATVLPQNIGMVVEDNAVLLDIHLSDSDCTYS